MDETRHLLRHFLATLAYRTQKALVGAPEGFGSFCAGSGLRTPCELLNHMTSLLRFTASTLRGEPWPSQLEVQNLAQETARFHTHLTELSDLLRSSDGLQPQTVERLLQGPFADAMTHVGQLAMLRRMAGSALGPESYFDARIETDNVGAEQSLGRNPA